jgi:hypothetical protein
LAWGARPGDPPALEIGMPLTGLGVNIVRHQTRFMISCLDNFGREFTFKMRPGALEPLEAALSTS